MQVAAERLSEYIRGMQIQREEAVRALAMLDGALQFANQLLSEIEAGEHIDSPASQENKQE